MPRHGLTDAQWERLRPLLPPEKPRTGRPSRPHREMVDAVLWVLAAGAPWRDLPEELGPWPSAYSRFRRWESEGVWSGVLAELQKEANSRGELDWRLHFVDGSVVRAHVSAAGAKKGGTRPSATREAASRPRSTPAARARAAPSASS